MIICCKELAPVIMEAEKSQGLQLTSWGPRRAGPVCSSESKSESKSRLMAQLKGRQTERILTHQPLLYLDL